MTNPVFIAEKMKKQIAFFYLLVVIGLSGCYAPGTFMIYSYPGGPRSLNVMLQLAADNPYIIGHTDSFAFRIASPRLTDNGNAVKAMILPLPDDRNTFRKLSDATHARPVEGMQKPYDELHVYLSIPPPVTGDSLGISNYEVMAIKVHKRSNSSRNMAVAGGVAGGLVITTVVVACVAATVAMVVLISEIMSTDFNR